MTARSSRRFLALLAWAGIALQTASAQTLARFMPVEAEGGSPGVLELRFVRERPSSIEFQPWPARESGWMFLRAEGTQHNLDALAAVPEDATLLRLEREGPGPMLVGWDLPPRVERTKPAELRAFLAERASKLATPRVLEALTQGELVPVLRLESLALVARPAQGAAAEPSPIAISKSGQRMELRALFDPSCLQAGSLFAFKLYLPEGGADNVVCRAVHLATRESQAIERLADGSLRARLERAGPWMLEACRLRALDGSAGAALELASSTLVFVVRPALARAKDGGGR